MVSSPALITLFLVNAFPNIIAVNVPNIIQKNSPSCSFALFLIVSLISFINNPDFLSDLTILLCFPFLCSRLLML